MIEIKFEPEDLEKIAEEARGKPSNPIAQLKSPFVYDLLEFVYFKSTSKPATEESDEVYQLQSTIIFTGSRKGIAVPKLSDDYSSIIYTPRGTSSASIFVKKKEKDTGIELRFRTDRNGDAYSTFSEEFQFENFAKYFTSLIYITERMTNDPYMRSGFEKTTMFDNIQMIIAPGGVDETYETAAETGLAPVEDDDGDSTEITDDISLHKSPERVMREILGPPSRVTVIKGEGRTFHARGKTDRKRKDNPNGNHLRLIRFDKPEEDKD